MSSPKGAPKKKAVAAPAKKPVAKPKAPAAKAAAPAQKKVVSREDVAASARAIALAKDIEGALIDGNLDFISPEAQQALMAALVKLFGANFENDNRYPIVSNMQAVTSTDVMVACAALLKSSNLQVFELGMWQSWTGR